jgi:hypothetical protein
MFFRGIISEYGVRFPTGVDVLQNVHVDCETHPVCTWCLAWVILPGIKRPGRESDHTIPSSVENDRAIALHPLYRFKCSRTAVPAVPAFRQKRLDPTAGFRS